MSQQAASSLLQLLGLGSVTRICPFFSPKALLASILSQQQKGSNKLCSDHTPIPTHPPTIYPSVLIPWQGAHDLFRPCAELVHVHHMTIEGDASNNCQNQSESVLKHTIFKTLMWMQGGLGFWHRAMYKEAGCMLGSCTPPTVGSEGVVLLLSLANTYLLFQ